MSYLDATDETFQKIRSSFFQKYKSQIDNGDYHPKDLERIKTDNNWLRAFYKHGMCNNDKTVSMINEVLLWRKEFDANSLLTPGKLPVPEELFTKGALFLRNEDINCNPLLHFVVKTHKKDQFPHAQVCRFIAYFFERSYKFNVDDPIVLLLDMSDTGYSNLDMDMIKFIVTCLKTYYPGLIDYMIIFQMPFIFNAAWKIIKNWLPPEAIKLIKFVDKKSIKEHVHETQLFVHMGGTDTYKYTYNPKEHIIENKIEAFQSICEFDQFKSITVEIPNIQNQNQDIEKNAEEVLSDSIEAQNTTISKIESLPETSSIRAKSNSKKATTRISDISFDNVLTTPLISISPGDELIFNIGDGKSDIVQYIKLTNTSESTLAYKIKITSPDKFRVKPGTGLIQTSGSVQIMVNFLKEFHNTTNNQRDKFLILWTQVDESLQQSELNEFWKQATQKKANINEHKVKCVVIRPNEPKMNSSPKPEHTLNNFHKESTSIKASKILGDTVTTFDRKSRAGSKIETNYQVEDKNLLEIKIRNLEINVNEVLCNQQKMLKNYSTLLFLVFFLILLNLIQLIFQSNLFSQVIEPYIDYLFFQNQN